MKILLLEDNKKLNETITKRLKLKGYNIDSYEDGAKALDAIDNGYSCFILDINVPNVDGIKILKAIREYYNDVPVIIISATVELDIIKESYDFGCNDYLKKPFFIDELEIKIEKLCKISSDLITIDSEISFDFKSSHLILKNQDPIKLTKKERLFINLMLNHKNNVVTFEAIESYVWEGSFATLDSIRSLVRRVRKLLPNDYIHTVVDTGYILKI